ncbi:MAG: histidine phosphatase family protein [Eubacteriales bacterium]|nr:histidine phosphatase family protein [Eubacteriales bacterium]
MLKIEVITIRHGWTPANEGRQFTGWSQTPLSSLGVEECLAKSKKLQRMQPFHAVLASPLSRCLETAKLLFPQFRPIIFPEFAERSFGKYEGFNLSENAQKPEFQNWLDNPTEWPESMESDEQLARRVNYGVQRIAKLARLLSEVPPRELFSEHVPEGQEPLPLVAQAALHNELRMVLVTHGGVISSLTNQLAKTTEGLGHYPQNLEAICYTFLLGDSGLEFVSMRSEAEFLPQEK